MIPGRFSGPRRLAEAGSLRGRDRNSDVLVKVHEHVRYALALLGPEADRETLSDLRTAQALIERRLGYIPMPAEGSPPRAAAAGHLQNALALCSEHFESGPPPNRVFSNRVFSNRVFSNRASRRVGDLVRSAARRQRSAGRGVAW